MNKANTSEISQQALQQTINSSKQASVVHVDAQQGFTLNAILDTDGSISLSPGQHLQSKPSELSVGNIDPAKLDNDDFLALLLDPQDINALIEANITHSAPEPKDDSLLFSGSVHNTILKLEDVLYKEDSLDEYLPPDESAKWYLYGDGRAIDGAISGPGMQDIHDALLMQQLLAQQYVE
ncbi:hypothetical protein A9R01_11345 ['Osedax' symbiont bacterium Rs2_46_30_T18]|nr:hypothetical protein A9R01_11345 ['Osedax' symbiont bacterium Rs2_46_30_T18]